MRKTVYWCIGGQIIQTNPLIVRLCFTLGSSHLLFHVFELRVPSTHRSVVTSQALSYMSPPQRSLPDNLVKSSFLIPYIFSYDILFLFLFFFLVNYSITIIYNYIYLFLVYSLSFSLACLIRTV